MLVVRISRDHPLPDGNKRLGWQSLTVFLALDGARLEVDVEDAVGLMMAVAAGDSDEATVVAWLREHVDEGRAGEDQ